MVLAPPFSAVNDPLWTPRGPSVPLTLSGNEITPYVRRFGREGDGLNPNELLGKYSIAPWEATQNKVTQSIPGAAADTNVTKAGDVAATLTLVADADRPFPNASATVWELDNSAGSTDATVDFAGNTGNTNKHSVSIYAKKSAGTPTLSLEGAGGVNVTQTSWDRSVSANLTPGGSTENLRVTCPAGAVVRFVAAQLEEQPLATPFTLTNGSAASRSAANIQLPNVQGLDETQSWIAFRVRMGWASGTSGVPIALPKLLSWRDDATHRIELYYATSTSVWSLVRANPTNGTVHTAADTFSVNDEVTVIAAWTGAALTLSIDGAAFNSSADAFVPVIAQTTPYIGCEAGPAGHFDSPILFIATGKDPLSGGNAAAINNIARNNRIDSRPSDLPGGCTMKWPPADGDISRMLVAA